MLTYRNCVPLLLSNVQTLLLMFHFVALHLHLCVIAMGFSLTMGITPQTEGVTCMVHSHR